MRRGSLACAAVMLLAGCGGPATGSRSEEILILAAASLKESFTQIGMAFEEARPAIRVRFSFGPSDGLATGINSGAYADVFASASPKWMDAVASSTGISDRAVFARNRLVVIVPRDNTAGVRTLPDLARPGVKLVIAAAAVPAGTYAREALAKANLQAAERNVVSNEGHVKGVVQKVVLGEADAGIVYATDVTSKVAPAVSVVPIPDAVNVMASYPIAVVRGSSHGEAARAFVAFVLGDGQAILRDAGFLGP